MSSVFAGPARALVSYCTSRGVDLSDILATLPPDSLTAPDARLPVELSMALWCAAYRRLGDPDLGLHLAESLMPGTYRVMFFLSAHSATLGDAFRRVCDYSRWAAELACLSLVPETSRCGVELALPAGLPQGAQHVHVEYVLAACYLGIQRATGIDFVPQEIELSYACATDAGERERVFRCPVRYGRPANRLWFGRDTLQRPVQAANDILVGVLEEHGKWLLSTLPDEPALVTRVRQVLVERLSEGPSLRQVARDLGVSTRAMQRALGEAGTSFSQLLRDARMESARTLLSDRALSLSDIAFLLGFSEQSAFTRAYKRWSGVPPVKTRPPRRHRS